MIPHAEHFGNAAGFKRAPDLRRAGDALEQAGLVNRLVLRRAGENRIFAMQDCLDVDVGPLLGVVGIVAHPLAERPFRLDLARHRFAFDCDLAISGNGEAGIGSPHHVDRLAAQPTGDLDLAHLWQRAR